jgi:hypothetical protein
MGQMIWPFFTHLMEFIFMSNHSHHFRFDSAIPLADIEALIYLALVVLNSLYGLTRVRLECHFTFDRSRRDLLVEGDTLLGRQLAQIITGLGSYLYSEEVQG